MVCYRREPGTIVQNEVSFTALRTIALDYSNLILQDVPGEQDALLLENLVAHV